MNRYSIRWLSTAVLIIFANVGALGQLPRTTFELVPRSPDGWFTVKVPKIIGAVERYADVDGGFYLSDSLEIGYNYWTYANTPNWLRGNYATSLVLACPTKNKNTWTRYLRIDDKRAVLQRCSLTDERKGYHHIYYVSFPKLRVFDGERFRYGMFNFRVEYRDRRYSSVAGQIIRSLNFEN